MMAAAGQVLKIGDLRAPVLDDAQRRALVDAEQAPLELSVDAVLSAAAGHARLDDFGPRDFIERLELLLDVVAWEGHTRMTQVATLRRMVAKAVDRLLTVHLLKRHPEIREERIEAPLIVAGLPRSGTTHLLNLIAADSRFQSLPYWEVLRPIPLLPADETGRDGVNPRRQRAQAAWEEMRRANPYAAAFHAMEPDHISEDGELQMADFSSYVWEFSLHAPDWRDYYLAHDQTQHYAYEKTMLQILQWQRAERRRWIVKSPQHFEQLKAIMNVFPDALVVFTHRDPVASLQSIATMHAYRARTRLRTFDPDAVLGYWADRYGRLLDAYARDVGLVPPAQRFDVLFHEFVGADIPTVRRLWDAADVRTTPTAERELAAYMAGHARGHAGRLVFDLRGDFGVEPAAVRERYREYVKMVSVEIEVE